MWLNFIWVLSVHMKPTTRVVCVGKNILNEEYIFHLNEPLSKSDQPFNRQNKWNLSFFAWALDSVCLHNPSPQTRCTTGHNPFHSPIINPSCQLLRPEWKNRVDIPYQLLHSERYQIIYTASDQEEQRTSHHNYYLVILNAGYPSKGLEYTDEEDTFIHRFADYRLET